MAVSKEESLKFLLPESSINRGGGRAEINKHLPKALGGLLSRSSNNQEHDPFINERAVRVESVFDLSGTGRSGTEEERARQVGAGRLLVLEATDGSTLIVRADKLKEDLARLYPEQALSGDAVNLRVLTDQEAASRGLSDWIWSKLSLLEMAPDGLVEAAKDKALELLKEKLGEHSEELIAAGASWAGAKALMWMIESQLVGTPGLYRWHERDLHPEDKVDVEDAELVEASVNNEPILLFIHGTASSTVGSFGPLHEGSDEGCWDNLTRGFAGRVYGYEHHTFSSSPLENALELARTLPKGSRISLVTHSRGGLVGDLLCVGGFSEDLVSRYQREPILEKEGEFKGKERPENKKLREAVVAEEKEQLRTLCKILEEKKFRIERYIRVACPASGTTLLSDNFDLFLSSLLSLFNFTLGLIPAVGTMGSTVLSAFRRIVLEIAEKRIDPRLVPGVEAMLPNSPLTIFLAQAPRQEHVDMAVVAGNVDGDSGGFLKRIAVMLTDWIIFDQFDNDFVVDTQSMRAGLARRNKTREYYVHSHQVSHLRYFERHDTRRAVYKWISADKPQDLAIFHPIPTDCDLKLDEHGLVEADAARSAKVAKDAPIVVYLPGVMGSHLEIRKENRRESEGDRVWFDPIHLTLGGIAQLSIDKDNVRPESIFRRYYGELEVYLQREHEVVTFAYDWRKSILDTADQLAKVLKKQLEIIKDQPHRQISILAHSMGGLVMRAMMAKHEDLWKEIVEKTGGYFVMLGTPNHGSHTMVENLIGKGRSVRQLAMLDFQHSLQEIIEVISGFEGFLQLMTPRQFADVGVETLEDGQMTLDYLVTKSWQIIRSKNQDRWFGDGLGAKPSANSLAEARNFWKLLDEQEKDNIPAYNDRIAYVFGLDAHTPCGVSYGKDESGLQLHGTAEGDGAVTWKSGRLDFLQNSQYWYMPVDHSGLTLTKAYFPAIVELLHKGITNQLEQKAPRTRSAIGRSYRYDAGPALQPGAEDLALSFFGGRPVRDMGEDQMQVLEVSVRAMDLRFAQSPIMCGHYLGDSIAGAESLMDQQLLKGALTQRERLGIYAGDVGSHTIVLNPRTPQERERDSGQGAIIVGLGEWNRVTVQKLTSTVRDGVLQYLLHSSECTSSNGAGAAGADDMSLKINSLLIGYNSTTHITVEASIEAIVLGVCEANQQYRHNKSKQQPGRAIRKLEFIEYYMDTAISAAYAVRELPRRLEKDLKHFDSRLVPASELKFKQGDGARKRLHEQSQGSGYWSRLMVTDAEQAEMQCPEECYDNWLEPRIPKKVMEAVKRQLGNSEFSSPLDIACDEHKQVVAERLKYVYLSERARAEAVIQQRQPGLVEALIKKSIRNSSYNPEVCRTLFQLMVPVDFKSAARQAHRLLMVLDGYTANLPWEMLQADGEPLVLKVAMVRQLVSTRFRKSVTSSLSRTACVIGNPATTDFHKHFDLGLNLSRNAKMELASLGGATEEAQEVAATLAACGYEVEKLYPKKAESKPVHSAIDVFNVLFKRPYRILMIAAHGEVNIVSRRDGRLRTGVVLSDGVMLTAAEIGQMEVVPDLVFLNCCHLAKVDGSQQGGETGSYNRLAYSVSRELIEMGVRCVIAAGWAVDDTAAKDFSTKFFELFTEGETFGNAVWQARKYTYNQHQNLNTWGAYQAYGDPNYVLNTDKAEDDDPGDWNPVAPDELISRLKTLQVDLKRSAGGPGVDYQQLSERVACLKSRVPPEWIHRPGIQYLLAELYGGMLPEGFAQAELACQQAIIEDDKEGKVPIKALELLGNLEARQAEALSERARDRKIESQQPDTDAKKKQELREERNQLLERAVRLSGSSIERLKGLLQITHDMHLLSGTDTGDTFEVNSERYALLGSALKRKATVMIRQDGAIWHDGKPKESSAGIKGTLEQCRNYYRQGEGVSFDLNFNPYVTINRLQLDGLFRVSSLNHVELAKKAQAAAKRKFTQSLEFFDAVMIVDALVAIYLLDEAEFQSLKDDSYSDTEFLIKSYTDTVCTIHYSATEFNSVTKQLDCLSVFLDLRSKHRAIPVDERNEDQVRSKVLATVASTLKKL